MSGVKKMFNFCFIGFSAVVLQQDGRNADSPDFMHQIKNKACSAMPMHIHACTQETGRLSENCFQR